MDKAIFDRKTIMLIIEVVPYVFLGGWLIYSFIYVRKVSKNPASVNKHSFELIPQIFTTIGILGTFLGIAAGLFFFDVKEMENSIPVLLDGLKTAFIASIFGIMLYLIFSKWTANVQHHNEKDKLSQESTILKEVIVSIDALKGTINDLFIASDENGNSIKPGNVYRDIYQESRKQSQALQAFSADLAIKIEAGFETIMKTQIEKGVIPELQSLKREIELLGTKLSDPTTEMTQSVVKDLENAMNRMVEEFRNSVSGSAKSEMENLANLLGKAGTSLTMFPAKLQEMTENLNQNFSNLQIVVQQISQQTLNQSSESTKAMRQQVEDMAEILRNKVGDLQSGQSTLLEKQKENIDISDHLLEAFNTSISKMQGLAGGINETIKEFGNVQGELKNTVSQLNLISNNVNAGTNGFRSAQQQFAEQNTQFLASNQKTIEEIQMALNRAKEVSAEYAQRFSVIERGLQSIFGQIQEGLEEYTVSVGSSLEQYLSRYSNALTVTAESLTGASSKQEEILAELTEQLSELKVKRN